MGAGASAASEAEKVRVAIADSGAEELKVFLASLPPEDKKKVLEAAKCSLDEGATNDAPPECGNKSIAAGESAPAAQPASLTGWFAKAVGAAPKPPQEAVSDPAKVESVKEIMSIAKTCAGKFVCHNPGRVIDFYNIDRKRVGEGSYAYVNKAEVKETRQVVCIKTVDKKNMKNLDRLTLEVNIQKDLDHPNIVKVYETFDDDRKYYIVMEFCAGGELFDRIIDAGCFSEKDCSFFMQQAFRAVNYMHGRNYAHRDLKPENFLLATRDPISRAAAKLVDFGLASPCEPGRVLTTKAGTPYYVSPQVLAGKYDHKCDMWSLGIIMYVCLCGYPPFYGESDAEVLSKVRLGNYSFIASDWGTVSESAKNLVRHLLKMNPNDRLAAQQAVDHCWFTEQLAGDAKSIDDLASTSRIVDNFKAFRAMSKFKKTALQVIATQLRDSEIKAMRELFVSLDTNGDGTLTLAELANGIQKAGLKEIPADLDELMGAVESNGNQVIDYTEFLAASLDKSVATSEDMLWRAFRVFDQDGNGSISVDELKVVLTSGDVEASEETIARVMSDVDKDGDKKIDFQEFVRMMNAEA